MARRDDFERTNEPKTCSVCGETKAAAEFHTNRRASDGLHAHCKACQKQKDMMPRYRWSRGRAYARRYNIEFTITPEQYEAMVTKPCHYCKGSIETTCGLALDRLDRAKGYTPDNVVQACWLCNHSKGPTFDPYEQSILSQHYPEFRERRARLGLPPLQPPKVGGGDYVESRTPGYWLGDMPEKRRAWKRIKELRDERKNRDSV